MTRQGRCVAGRREETDLGTGNHIADTADIGTDGCAAGGEALDQCHRRPFVLRCEEEHIGGGVENIEIAPPAEESDALANAVRDRARFESPAQLAVSGDQKKRVWNGLNDLSGCIEEDFVIFYRRKPADGRNDMSVRRKGKDDAGASTGTRVDAGKLSEVESKRHNAVLLRATDSITSEKVFLHSGRHGDEPIGDAREPALDPDEGCGRGPSEIPLQYVAVVGLDDARPVSSADRAVVGRCRKAPQRAGLRHVRVDDVRSESTQHPIELPQCPRVVGRGGTTLQHAHGHGRRPGSSAVEQVAHVALSIADGSVHEERVHTAFRQPRGEIDRLNRRAADVQARNNPRDAHAADDITR